MDASCSWISCAIARSGSSAKSRGGPGGSAGAGGEYAATSAPTASARTGSCSAPWRRPSTSDPISRRSATICSSSPFVEFACCSWRRRSSSLRLRPYARSSLSAASSRRSVRTARSVSASSSLPTPGTGGFAPPLSCCFCFATASRSFRRLGLPNRPVSSRPWSRWNAFSASSVSRSKRSRAPSRYGVWVTGERRSERRRVSRLTCGPSSPRRRAAGRSATGACWSPGGFARQPRSATLMSTSSPSTRQGLPSNAPAYCQARWPRLPHNFAGRFRITCGSCFAGPWLTQLATQTNSAGTPPSDIALSGPGFA